MRFLHTSDWHVGKAIRGHSRESEHQAVLDEIGAIAADREVDLTIVAGDLFDTAAPTAASERLVYNALLALADVAPVIVIAGNHDSARRLDAVARLLALGRVLVATEPRRPSEGGVAEMATEDGTPIQVALVPFVSQRAIVRADALMDEPAFRNAQTYATKLQAVIAALSAGFSADSVNLLVAHLFVAGGTTGGGERAAHLVEEYAVSAVDIPATVSYAALGHLHRPQAIPGKSAIHYCGSPLQLDFGEQQQTKQVNLVDVEPGLPAKVEAVPLRSGRQLITLTGTLDQLRSAAAEVGDAWLRIRVRETARVGLADDVRDLLGEAVVDVRVEQLDSGGKRAPARRDGRSPSQLFGDYLREREIGDARLQRAFESLHDEFYAPDEPLPADVASPTDAEAAAAEVTGEESEAPIVLDEEVAVPATEVVTEEPDAPIVLDEEVDRDESGRHVEVAAEAEQLSIEL